MIHVYVLYLVWKVSAHTICVGIQYIFHKIQVDKIRCREIIYEIQTRSKENLKRKTRMPCCAVAFNQVYCYCQKRVKDESQVVRYAHSHSNHTHLAYIAAPQMPNSTSPSAHSPSSSTRCVKLVFKGPVRSGYWVFWDPNRDRDRLGFIPRPKIT